MADDNSSSFAPFMLGRHRVLCPLGEGGMAEVFLAETPGTAGFSRRVCIKRVKPEVAHEPQYRNMFVDEARIMLRVEHPNVVQVLELQEADADLYLVLEYVDGGDLKQLLRAMARAQRRMDWGVAVYVAWCVSRALARAHAATSVEGRPLNLVHRDVSPGNVLLGRGGQVKLADFGVARAAGRLVQTQPGGVRGNLAYMAPEVLMRAAPDVRSDVFSAGVVAWEALCGRRLFPGSSAAQLADAIQHRVIPPPSQLSPGVPAAVDAAVMAALERSPEQRTPTAQALQDALWACLGGRSPDALESLLATLVDAHLPQVWVAPGAPPSRRPPPLPPDATEGESTFSSPNALDSAGGDLVSLPPRTGEPPRRTALFVAESALLGSMAAPAASWDALPPVSSPVSPGSAPHEFAFAALDAPLPAPPAAFESALQPPPAPSLPAPPPASPSFQPPSMPAPALSAAPLAAASPVVPSAASPPVPADGALEPPILSAPPPAVEVPFAAAPPAGWGGEEIPFTDPAEEQTVEVPPTGLAEPPLSGPPAQTPATLWTQPPQPLPWSHGDGVALPFAPSSAAEPEGLEVPVTGSALVEEGPTTPGWVAPFPDAMDVEFTAPHGSLEDAGSRRDEDGPSATSAVGAWLLDRRPVEHAGLVWSVLKDPLTGLGLVTAPDGTRVDGRDLAQRLCVDARLQRPPEAVPAPRRVMLESAGVQVVIKRLGTLKQTGMVLLGHGSGDAALFIRQGVLVHVFHPPGAPLVDALLELQPGALDALLRRACVTVEPLMDSWTAATRMAPEASHAARRAWLSRALAAVLERGAQECSFHPGVSAPGDPGPPVVPLTELVAP